MTQAQIDLQQQLEQASSDLTTQPLFNDSPVLFLETSYQIVNHPSKELDQTEHDTSKVPTQLDYTDITHETPLPPKKRDEIMKDPVFLSSPTYHPTIPSNPSLSTNRDDHLLSVLLHSNFTFKGQQTSLYLHPTDYKFRLYDKHFDFSTSIASKILAPFRFWLDYGIKIFCLQVKFLRPSIYDLKTEELDPSFLSTSQNVTDHQTHTKFLQHTKPKNYIFANYKYNSSYTMTNLYTIDHAQIKGYLRIFAPKNKTSVCLLSMTHHSHLLYLKIIFYISMIFVALQHSYSNFETSHC